MDSTDSSGYYQPLVEPVPMEGFFNNIMAQQFSFVDEATYHMDNFREDYSCSGLVNGDLETVDPGFPDNLAPKLGDALRRDGIPDLAPYPPVTESLSVASSSNTSSLQHSATGMAPADCDEPNSTPKQAAENHQPASPDAPLSVSESAAIAPSNNTNGTARDLEKSQYDPTDSVNLDFFQPKAPAETCERETCQEPDFRSCPINTGGFSDFGTKGDYSHHLPSYPSPVRSTPFSTNTAGSEGAVPAADHQPETMKREAPLVPTSPTSPVSQGGPDPELQFSCAEEANAWRAFEVQVDYDPTIPRTPEAKRKIVTEMLKAMKSVEYAQDNEGMIRPFREQKQSPIRMEIVCWNILDSCISRHEHGPLLAIYDGKAKTTGQIPTFGERMEKIIECLWTQKTICKHLLDAYYLFTFVDDPVCARNRVVANKNLNKRKGEVMNAGKKALGHSRSNSKSTPAKRTSEAREGLCTPFSTPRKETPAMDNSTPTTINNTVRNMTLDSSPPVHSHGTQQMRFSSPAKHSTQENMAHPMHHGMFPMATHPQLINTPATGRAFGPNSMAASGFAGHCQPVFGFGRNQSPNAIHGLGQNLSMYNRGPYNREEMTEQFRQCVPAQFHPAMYCSPAALNPNYRAMGPAPHACANYQRPTPSSPARQQSRNAPSAEASYGHSRKRSQDESDATAYALSPQKKAR
ncbi:uncharacterized protein BDCG_06917 [Blastomyces dermatitidis ER-3]|uniref:Uncharacterized protein n=1 Tax=Ajellomyces dermatitidis (strain ER-3 / ATCC MYA-2586) TaxID=559297 RepID=A0ABP2F780_AJEDR|nr:uncharacterized protein BDCG_06917 [Blastomyces dermatitidis ER-3]EEQ91797.2 hypothetical protein BDCG_06917 [Blastomyces dermatitidis ER-3]